METLTHPREEQQTFDLYVGCGSVPPVWVLPGTATRTGAGSGSAEIEV